MANSIIRFFEKHILLSWTITLLLAVIIFYVSSLKFKPAPEIIFDIKPVAYHLFAFFWFSFFLFLTIIKGKVKSKKILLLPLLISLIYAMTDEIHQIFVPGRSCSLSDFLIDSCGIFFAGLIYLLSIKKIRTSVTAV